MVFDELLRIAHNRERYRTSLAKSRRPNPFFRVPSRLRLKSIGNLSCANFINMPARSLLPICQLRRRLTRGRVELQMVREHKEPADQIELVDNVTKGVELVNYKDFVHEFLKEKKVNEE